MSVLAEFSLPAEAAPIGRAFEVVPKGRIELERIVLVGDATISFVWPI